MRSVNGRWGTTWFFGKDEYVGKSLYHYGEYNPDETEMILSLAVPGKLCLDIGANFGVIGQALEYSGFEVVSFEPQPDVYNILAKNVKGEKYNCALGDVKGFDIMPKIYPGSKANYGGMGVGHRSTVGYIQVPVATLDSFNFKNVGFIKIDVEGFEEKVLIGGRSTILENRPIMYIEDDRVGKSADLRKYISSLGYNIREHKPTLYREDNYFGLRRNVWEKQYASHNLICY